MDRQAADPVVLLSSGATKDRLTRGGIVIVGWTVVALVVTGQAYIGLLANPRPGLALGRIFAAELLAWYFWALVTPLVWWLSRRYPLDRRHWIGSLVMHALCAVLLVTTHTAVVVPIIFMMDLLPNEPGATELFLFRASIRFHVGLLVYAALVVLGQAIDRSVQLRQRDVRAAQVETKLVEAQLTALRSQLRPHFLFNTLNTVAMLIRERAADRALHVVVHLSDLLRSVLKSGDDLVPLEQELALLRSYVSIEVLRHEDRLTVEYDVEERALTATVPPLLLQPLVENAVRHSIGDDLKPVHIGVVAKTDGNTLVISVLDNGPGIPPGWSVDQTDGIGLRNVRERLAMLYDGRHRFTVGNRAGGGTEVSLRIPLSQPTADESPLPDQVGEKQGRTRA